MKKFKYDNLGFTVIELIVVITVMSLLFGVVYGIQGSQKQKTAASTVYSDLKTIELALDSFARADGINEWWPQSQFGSTAADDDPTISEVQSSTDLKRYLPTVPEPPIVSSSGYKYDNDAEYNATDSYNPSSCGTGNIRSGINLILSASAGNKETEKIFDLLDETNDDGNRSCGRITQATDAGVRTLFYHVAIDKDDYPSSL